MEAYLAQDPPPDQATLLSRRREFFSSFYREKIEEAEQVIYGMLDQRDAALDRLTEREEITPRHRELEPLLEELKQPRDASPT